jgi:prolyl oligopeptidase
MHKLAIPLLAAAALAACSQPGPPETPRSPVTDTYHGVTVTDDYRWLEDWDDPKVREWSDAQNVWARDVLDALPSRETIRGRVAEILEAESDSYRALAWRGGRLFAVKNQPPKEQPFLVGLPSPDRPDEATVVLDPNEIDPEGSTTIDWYVPSPDGKRVAVSLSRGGSESGDVHVVDVVTGERVDEIIPRVNGGTAGGDLTWTPDGNGFFYTRYPRPGERPEEDLDFYQQLWFHELGTPLDRDRIELGDGLPRVAEIKAQTGPSGRVLATVQDGDSGRFEHHLRGPDGTWVQLTRHEDRVVQAELAADGSIFMISRMDAPRGKVLRMPRERLSIAAARTIVEQGPETIVSDFYGPSPMVITAGRLYLTYQLGGPSTIRVFDHSGRAQSGPQVLAVSRVGQIVALDGDTVLYENESYLVPSAWYRFDPSSERSEKTALAEESPVDLSGIEVARETATSKDGTAVPVNITKTVGTALDGSNPALLYGYGGYGVSVTPGFNPVLAVWLEQGGVYAAASIRGGGEFGEAWHRAGTLTRKQNVFDDFAAAMQHLIDGGYTSPERLAILGGSNGGLLMGAMITQVPERARAVVSVVGIYDMLRVELSPNGAFNIPEYGTVKDEDQFRALYSYSPYHNVEDKTGYPAVLFMTGANDPRVDPMQSRKMTARLQAATGSGKPILLRTSAETGHGGGTPLSARIEEYTDWLAFLFSELGVPYHP